MTVERRLSRLEGAAVQLPRGGADLLREADRLSGVEAKAWLKTLTDAELIAYGQALDARYWAEGRPVYDLSVLTDKELERVCNGNDAPLAKCPILPPPLRELIL